MPAQLILKGFDELLAELAALPDASKRDAQPILLRYAKAALDEIVARYPIVTGTLRAGVRIVERTPHGVAALYTLATTAPYAHIFEFGSVHQRPRATFLPVSERSRRAAVAAVAAMVEDKGLVVGGNLD